MIPVVFESRPRQPLGPRAGRALLAMLLAGGVALAHAPAMAAEADTSEGVEMLQRMHKAARSMDYAGVYTYQQGSTILSTQIVHVLDGTGERERLSLLDGEPREYIRHNEITQCLLPDHRVVLTERRESDRFPAVLLDGGEHLATHYVVSLREPMERVAGRMCQTLELAPRDNHRYGYRFCADKETGLPLRAQTVGPEGVLIQMVFNTVQVGSAVSPELLAPAWNTKGWQVVELPVQEIDLASEGWRIPLPPGYRPLKQVLRPLKAGRQVKQMVVSDGLASMSVFIEAYTENSDQPREAGLMRNGAVSLYRKRIGDHWLTVLGEVPFETVRDLADRTEFVPLAVP